MYHIFTSKYSSFYMFMFNFKISEQICKSRPNSDVGIFQTLNICFFETCIHFDNRKRKKSWATTAMQKRQCRNEYPCFKIFYSEFWEIM